jgi:outer membrane protein OmpA-like peptidoglycan-associated protein
MKTKKLLLISLLIGNICFLNAQTASNQWALGVHVGSTKYVGDLGGNALTDFTHSQYVLGYFNGGLSLQKYLNPSFDLGIFADYSLYGTYTSYEKKFLSTKFESSLFGHYKFNNGYIISASSKFSPFLSLGLGLASYGKVQDYKDWADVDGIDFIVPVGAGIKYQFTNRFAVQYKYQYNFTTSDKHDKVVSGGNDAWGEHLVGFIFGLGKSADVKSSKKDADGDGVSDLMDKCPGTPAGVKVDGFGCPLDSDKDGVADYLDKEPNTPSCAKVDANGVSLDSDKDGVADYQDKCPGTPAGVKVDGFGCPLDTDKDGVPDYLDKEINSPSCAKVDANGVALDSDKDGVADYMDKCPDTPAGVKVDALGCPVDNAGLYNLKLENIYFNTGKATLTSANNPALAKAVEFLKKNSDAKLNVDGHADSVGSSASNMALSQKRAEAVKAYLVKKGISASRLSTTGFGEDKPAADNATAAGRAKNRRVELK